ncbi:hypothetical protein [Lentzea sp. NBRC 102530]|uniref:hypothetical protein n=1 Tax=Lentzea sp. NBRC 102530 TaxID=3032201 RepID=UPI0024A2EA38|nr:hypothetical protein [Lentzea sp. NBRC 102530]GLY50577.1 hypothetical protein Lesp01_42330 [Lentzea sp. NBRC 102530]
MTSQGSTAAAGTVLSGEQAGQSAIERALVRLGRERDGGADEINAHTDHTNTHSSNPW